jgi:hypothetical protein
VGDNFNNLIYLLQQENDMEERPDKLRPALIGGALIGIISAIPVLSLVNCFCCAGVIIGGILAVHLYHKNLGGLELTSSDGATLGLMAGASGALISTVLAAMMSGGVKHQIDKILEYSSEMPPEVEDALIRIQEMGGDLFFTIAGLVFSLIIFSIFGIIGGLIAVSILKKKQLPQ